MTTSPDSREGPEAVTRTATRLAAPIAWPERSPPSARSACALPRIRFRQPPPIATLEVCTEKIGQRALRASDEVVRHAAGQAVSLPRRKHFSIHEPALAYDYFDKGARPPPRGKRRRGMRRRRSPGDETGFWHDNEPASRRSVVRSPPLRYARVAVGIHRRSVASSIRRPTRKIQG